MTKFFRAKHKGSKQSHVMQYILGTKQFNRSKAWYKQRLLTNSKWKMFLAPGKSILELRGGNRFVFKGINLQNLGINSFSGEEKIIRASVSPDGYPLFYAFQAGWTGILKLTGPYTDCTYARTIQIDLEIAPSPHGQVSSPLTYFTDGMNVIVAGTTGIYMFVHQVHLFYSRKLPIDGTSCFLSLKKLFEVELLENPSFAETRIDSCPVRIFSVSNSDKKLVFYLSRGRKIEGMDLM